MFSDLLNFLTSSFEVAIYLVIILTPVMILSLLLVKIKNRFFGLRKREFRLKQEMIMFEIKNPKEVFKTPEAMENVLASFFNASKEGSWFDKVWKGQERPTYSLEIASIDGNVKFFVWARKGLKELIEAAFYSQYPEIEVLEVSDYTKYFSWEKHAAGGLFGTEFVLSKPDPIPIKTYKYWNISERGIDPEQIIDPISFTVESLANIGKGENFWLQFVIRGQKKDIEVEQKWWEKLLHFTPKTIDWKKSAEEEIQKMKEKLAEKGEEGVKFQSVTTDIEKEVINATIENTSKPSYWTGIRVIYFAEKDKFNPGQITTQTSIFNNYKSDIFNSFGISFVTGFDYPWQDPTGERAKKLKERIFKDFRKRYFFQADYLESKIWPGKTRYKTCILSTEELATVFHPPTSSTATPTFERVTSKKADPPANLPI